ncbi:hypothetical protein I7I48_00510 [Histoplasma ohiense]|nr:hypothetical protein I7I48_00510 [Histoplasma ohiense (nom. inval.)]
MKLSPPASSQEEHVSRGTRQTIMMRVLILWCLLFTSPFAEAVGNIELKVSIWFLRTPHSHSHRIFAYNLHLHRECLFHIGQIQNQVQGTHQCVRAIARQGHAKPPPCPHLPEPWPGCTLQLGQLAGVEPRHPLGDSWGTGDYPPSRLYAACIRDPWGNWGPRGKEEKQELKRFQSVLLHKHPGTRSEVSRAGRNNITDYSRLLTILNRPVIMKKKKKKEKKRKVEVKTPNGFCS